MAAKRAMDVIESAFGLLLLLPVFAVIAVLIRLDSPGPIFFRQERVGRGGRAFRIYKFRSMVVGAERAGTALTVHADPRITRVGMFLRKSKLDELPQLINVLVGDMSIVGPRPEVPDFMKFYTPAQRAIILAMRPGITDYAAVLFRDESSLLDGERDPISVYQREIMPTTSFPSTTTRRETLCFDIRFAASWMVSSGPIVRTSSFIRSPAVAANAFRICSS